MVDAVATFYQSYNNLIFTVLVNMLLALSIYVTLIAGQLSLSNAAFMGIGAYTSALLTMKLAIPFPVALIAGALAPTMVAAVLGAPTLRLKGFYLAIATLGFGEVVRVVALNLHITGGALGLNAIPQKSELWMPLIFLTGLIYFFHRLPESTSGRAFSAIRQDEGAAQGLGINTTYFKVLAFVMGAFIAGAAGALSAHRSYFIEPKEFDFDDAVQILTYTIFGGTFSHLGPVVGAGVLTLLPELLRPLKEFRVMLNGLIIVIFVIYLPRGIVDPALLPKLFKKDTEG